MTSNCPCPKDGCVKTARYIENHSQNWSGHVCPHCGNAIIKRESSGCPCISEFCPCKGMNMEHMRHHSYQQNCPCIKADCDCLSAT